MKAVYCDWPECKYWVCDTPWPEEGQCTKEVIRMFREPIYKYPEPPLIKSTIKDPPTCAWYTEREKKNESMGGKDE